MHVITRITRTARCGSYEMSAFNAMAANFRAWAWGGGGGACALQCFCSTETAKEQAAPVLCWEDFSVRT